MSEYITQYDAQERAGLLNCSREEYESKSHLVDAAYEELEREHLEQIFDWHTEAVERLAEFDVEDRAEIAWMLLKGMGKDDDECPVDAQGLFFTNWEITQQLNQWQFDNVEYGGSFYDVDLLEGVKCCEATDKEYELKADLKPAQVIQLDQIINTTKELAYSRVKKMADKSALGGIK